MQPTELSRRAIKELAALRRPEGRSEQGRFLVEGSTLVEEAIASGWEVAALYASEDLLARKPEWRLQEGIQLMPAEQLGDISDLKTPPEIAAVVSLPTSAPQINGQSLLYLDGISDPGNLGTIIRTADWFGITTIVLGPGSADPFNPKVVRGAMGSIFRVRTMRLQDEPLAWLRDLRGKGYQILVTSPHDEQGEPTGGAPVCLVLGSEAHGVDESILAEFPLHYRIPGFGKVESLNVGVSAAIALFDLKVVRRALD